LSEKSVFKQKLSCDCVETASFSFSLSELQNGYGTLHGGAVGSLVEVLSTACARTVVAEDKELFLGEISISYLSGTPINVSCFHW
jgi:acyl-coenzyme A thioesterase PaaI-like protein